MDNMQIFIGSFLAFSAIGFILMVRITISEIINPCVINSEGKWIVYLANGFVVSWGLLFMFFVHTLTGE